MRWIRYLFLAILADSASLAQAADVALHVTLNPSVQVEAHSVLLGDIATLSGGNGDSVNRLAASPIAPAPQPGYTLHLSRDEIAHLMRGLTTASVVLDGAPAVSIETQTTTFDSAAVVALAQRHLRDSLLAVGHTLDITPLDPSPPLALAHGVVDLRPRPIQDRRAYHQMTVWVDLYLDGRFDRAVPTRFKVTDTVATLVARRDLPKGTTLDCNNAAQVPQDVAPLDVAALTTTCDSVHARLKRSVVAGEVLTVDQVEPNPAVHQGERVAISVAQGAVVLESSGIALEDGLPGQRIPVRAAQASDPILALVVAPGQVKVTDP
ncbi:MAG: flagellar basal body P-ring formation protein FlgA [Burkholderiales bacterium]|nr:flagellar basal body P-ring formation protein FlgA [Burkholderiales bacterium]